MGGINFGWLAVWDLSPEGLKHKGYATIIRHLGEAAVAGGGGAGHALTLHLYPGIWLTTEEKHGKSQGIQEALC
jgi:hypothetical protein